jgi:hypothetical protein
MMALSTCLSCFRQWWIFKPTDQDLYEHHTNRVDVHYFFFGASCHRSGFVWAPNKCRIPFLSVSLHDRLRWWPTATHPLCVYCLEMAFALLISLNMSYRSWIRWPTDYLYRL